MCMSSREVSYLSLGTAPQRILICLCVEDIVSIIE